MNPSPKTRAASLIAGLALGTGTPPSLADHYGYANSNQDYYVFINDMVDFDQKRDAGSGILGLPADDDGDGGAMYCVPTSTSDLFAYVERHGYANEPLVVGPGVMDWSDPADVGAYNAATSYIGGMGSLMFTDPDGGTSNDNNRIFNAVRIRLPVDRFDVVYYARDTYWSPKALNIAGYLFNGGIVQFCYGRWNVGGADDTLVSRDGGHCVVMTKVDKRTGFGYGDDEQRISYANPSNSSNTMTQASFFYQSEDTVDFNYFLEDNGNFRRMTRILFEDPGDARHRIIDSALAVYPKQGFTSWPAPHNLTLYSGTFNWGGADPDEIVLTTYVAPNNAAVLTGAVSPDRGFGAYVTAGVPATGVPGTLYHLDLATGLSTPIDSILGPTGLVFHRDRTAFVCSASEIRRLEMDTDLPAGAARLSWSLPLTAASCDAIAYDDNTDEVVSVSTLTHELIRYEAGLSRVGGGDAAALPTALVLAGRIHLASDPAGDGVLIVSEGSGTASLVEPDPTGRLVIGATYGAPAGSALGAGSINDDGHVFLLVDGAAVELADDGAGSLAPVGAGASPIAGVPGAGFFDISRSRTNFVANLHSGPEWQNVDPDELPAPVDVAPPCRVDFAQPFEVLDFFDILAFLSLFDAGHPQADLSAPFGTLDFFDILEFLAQFSAGCP